MPRKSDAKDQMIRTAAVLFQRQGYHGTGLAEVLAVSGAPKGSVYHHFPGGKEELAVHAIRRAGEDVRQLVLQCFAAEQGLAAGIDRLALALVQWFDTAVEGTGCPIAAVLVDAGGESEQLRTACSAALRSWAEVVKDAAQRAGFTEDQAAALGQAMVIALEGAWIVARASHSSRPFGDAASIVRAYAASLPTPSPD